MRISVDKTDPGWKLYNSDPKLQAAQITLDGDLLKYCITADEGCGYVLLYATDHKGSFIYDCDNMTTKELCGEVKIVY